MLYFTSFLLLLGLAMVINPISPWWERTFCAPNAGLAGAILGILMLLVGMALLIACSLGAVAYAVTGSFGLAFGISCLYLIWCALTLIRV